MKIVRNIIFRGNYWQKKMLFAFHSFFLDFKYNITTKGIYVFSVIFIHELKTTYISKLFFPSHMDFASFTPPSILKF